MTGTRDASRVPSSFYRTYVYSNNSSFIMLKDVQKMQHKAAALAEAEPKPAQAYQLGSGFRFGKPRPRKAEPSRRLSGRAEPADH
jgi:hypothetical protein